METKNKDEEGSNFIGLVASFLFIIGIGVLGMLLVGYFDTKNYESQLSSAVQSFEDLDFAPSRENGNS